MKPPILDTNWSHEIKALYKHDMQEIWDKSLARQIWNQYHNQLEIYLKLAAGEKKDILDVGCAQATLALVLAENGHNVTAVDIRQEFLDYAKSRYTHGNIEFICSNALEFNLDKKFDLIYANQIIEHLVYPVEFVKQLSQLLKPNGTIIVTTPNHRYIKNTLPSYSELGNPKDWEHKQFTADGDGHFFAYTAEELEQIAKSSGCKDVSVNYFESPWISGHIKVRHIHRIAPLFLLKSLDKLTVSTPVIGSRLTHQLICIIQY